MSHYIEYKKYPYYFITGNASSFCLDDALIYCKGKGLDIGGGNYKFPGARLIEKNIEEDAFNILEPDNSIDYVFSSHCLEHFDEEQQHLFFKEASRVLKKNGILYIYIPSTSASLWNPTVMHEHKFIPDMRQILDYCEIYNLSIVNISALPDFYLSKRLVLVKQ